MRLLRQRGFAGHITAGGALATLERARLLADHPAIDSVVRHAGEAVMVELARALGEGGDLAQVPGLTTRLGEGGGNPHAFTASRLWPLRAEAPPTLIGIPKADVAASRGCAGGCAYCGVSALERELDHERRLLGLDQGAARGSIHRPIDDLADEVAALYHDRGVRVVQVVDDNLLGPDARAARAWLADLEAALSRRRVGTMAWRLMAEPSVLSDEVVDALARLGALFGAGRHRIAHAAGQGGPAPARERRPTMWLPCTGWRRAGLRRLLNVLALRPDGTLDDARAELAGLGPARRLRLGGRPADRVAGHDARGAARGQGATGRAGRGLGVAALRAGNRALPLCLEPAAHGRPGVGDPAAVYAGRDVRAARGAPARPARRRARSRSTGRRPCWRRPSACAEACSSRRSPWRPRRFPRANSARRSRRCSSRRRSQLAPFDERFACLLDEVSWPDAHATAQRPARRLASPWLAHGLMMAMATGCAGSGAQPPIVDAAAERSSHHSSRRARRHAEWIRNRWRHDRRTRRARPMAGRANPWTASCDVNRLEDAVSRVAGWSCEANGLPTGLAYAVVIDCDGRAIELLYPSDRTPLLSGDARQAWLDSLANDRWVCFAGQSVQFTCMICLFPP